jgi:hypothetical protein
MARAAGWSKRKPYIDASYEIHQNQIAALLSPNNINMADRASSPSGSSRNQQTSRRAQKLSDERLARKRELDRQAQRSARVKTKNHIAHLESRIEALTQVQGNGDVRGLIEQIEEQRKEIEALKTTLKTIGKLVGNTGDNGEPNPINVYRRR